MITAATGWAGLAAALAPLSAAAPSLLVLSSLPGEVFGGEAGAEGPGVLAAIAFSAAASAAASGCEFGSFGSLGVFPVVAIAGMVLTGVLAVGVAGSRRGAVAATYSALNRLGSDLQGRDRGRAVQSRSRPRFSRRRHRIEWQAEARSLRLLRSNRWYCRWWPRSDCCCQRLGGSRCRYWRRWS